MPAWSSQARTARTGQVRGSEPYGKATGSSLPFLVGLRLAEPHDESVRRRFQILDAQRGQFRPAKAARKARQQQCPITHPLETLWQFRNDALEIGRQQRLLSLLGRSLLALDSLPDFTHNCILHRRGRRLAGHLMRPVDGGEAPGQAGGLQRGRAVGEVKGYRLGQGWQGRQLMGLTPLVKVPPICLVSPQSIAGFGSGREFLSLLAERGQSALVG